LAYTYTKQSESRNGSTEETSILSTVQDKLKDTQLDVPAVPESDVVAPAVEASSDLPVVPE